MTQNNKNQEFNYVAYAYGKGADDFVAFKLKNTATDSQIHRTIANFENNEVLSGRTYISPVQAGSFNFKRVKASDARNAVQKGVADKLKFEPMSVVFQRNADESVKHKNTNALRDSVEEQLKTIEDMIGKMGSGNGSAPSSGFFKPKN